MSRGLAVLVAMLLSAVVGATIVPAAPPSGTWLLVWANTFLTALPFLIAFFRRRLDIFEPVYLFALSFSVLFVLRPALDLSTPGGLPVLLGYQVGATYRAALQAGAIGASAFYVGYFTPFRRGTGRVLVHKEDWLASSTLNALAVVAVGIATVLYGAFIVTSGGTSTFKALLSGRNSVGSQALHVSSGYLYSAPVWLVSVGVLLLAVSTSWRSRRALIGGLLIVISQAMQAASGDRSYIVPAAATVAVLWFLKRGRRPGLWTILLIMPLAFFFGIVLPGQYRNTDDRQGSLGDTVVRMFTDPQTATREFFIGADTAMIDDLAVELQFIPVAVPYQYGATYIAALSRPIPRNLWPNKPEASDTKLMHIIWPAFWRARVGFSFSIFGEPYFNFGYIGVVGILTIYGRAWRSIYQWYSANPTSTTAAALYSLIWPFLFVDMRGGLTVEYQRIAYAIFPALVIIVLTRYSSTPRRRVNGVIATRSGIQSVTTPDNFSRANGGDK